MSNYYVYQRLEDLAHELNPSSTSFPLSDSQIQAIIEQIKREKQRFQTELQDLYYRNNETESTRQLIIKSHHSLVIMINKAYESRHHQQADIMNVAKPLDELLHQFDLLLHWFLQNFKGYLGSDQPYPITKLNVVRSMILDRLDHIQQVLHSAGNHQDAIDVVIHTLKDFVDRIDKGDAITRHEAEYHQDLFNDIERTNGQGSLVTECPPLHELLVYWNLNSKECIGYFTRGLNLEIAKYSGTEAELAYLLLQEKYVHQMPELPNFKYDPRYPGIKDYFSQYIAKEIEYREHLLKGFQPLLTPSETPAAEHKVLCNLSVDQLGLLLRGLYEMRIITAKSMSEVFKHLVNFLITPHTDHISWENMRRKAYKGEDRDKDICRELLLELADKISGY